MIVASFQKASKSVKFGKRKKKRKQNNLNRTESLKIKPQKRVHYQTHQSFQ